MQFNISGLSDKEHISLTEKVIDGITYIDLYLTADEKISISNFRVNFSFPDTDCYSVWNPCVGQKRNLAPNWLKRSVDSRLASYMPIHSLISLSGKNRLCIAVSDVRTPIKIATGISEETADFDCFVEFFTTPTTPLTEYKATIRIDTRDVDFYDSIYDVSSWWEGFYTPAYVPEAARAPMNSLWYSFHQNLVPEEIIKQCKLSKSLGLDTVIIDDGWQTDDSSRGYSYCGDWEPSESKIPDMKKLVDDIHNAGLKVILWFSVPFVGVHSKAYQKFKNMLLCESGKETYCLDPRYKEIREYLVEIYADALKNWGLDGLKLDFIDSFWLSGKALEYDEKRDYESLEDGIEALMTEACSRLREINPEVLIEFRQSYIGPAIRHFGNMLRVADCPSDALPNRVAIVDMRLTSGNTPVHSDMIMWNYSDSVESASLQFANILYSVPQISMLIDKLSPEHYKMLKYYLNFWKEHKKLLLDGRLTSKCPESSYSQVRSDLDGKSVITLYTDRIAENIQDYSVIVNASPYESILIKGCVGKNCTVLNCMGEGLKKLKISESITEIAIPTGGMAIVE